MVNTELQSNRNVPAAKGLRTAGQVVALTINIVVIYCILNAIRKSRRANHGKRTHPTLLVLSAACPLLLIRGVYGVLTGILPAFNDSIMYRMEMSTLSSFQTILCLHFYDSALQIIYFQTKKWPAAWIAASEKILHDHWNTICT